MRRVMIATGDMAGKTGYFHEWGMMTYKGSQVPASAAIVEMDKSGGGTEGRIYLFPPHYIQFMKEG